MQNNNFIYKISEIIVDYMYEDILWLFLTLMTMTNRSAIMSMRIRVFVKLVRMLSTLRLSLRIDIKRASRAR